jgi:LCP family protein required for cell wall assembly
MNKKVSKKQNKPDKQSKQALQAKQRLVRRVVPIILSITQLIASVALIFALKKLNLLQAWQMAITAVALLCLEALTVYKLIFSEKAKRTAKIIVLIVSLLISVGATIGYRYVRQTVSFIESITGAHHETQTYKVLVLKSSQYNNIGQLNNQHIGFLKNNPNLSNTKDTLKNTISYKEKEFDELGSLLAGIQDYKVSAIALTDSYLEFLEENENEFIENSKVIYEYEVRVDSEKDIKRVNVATDPFIIYISGSDSRIGINDTARSDVNIVAVVNPKQAKVLLVSIPRDYYVQLHGTTGTKDKLTHAGIYGTDMSKNTIQDLLGIDVNYTVKVGFSTVIKIVDKVGGIDIYSDKAFTAWASKDCKFVEGDQHVNSACALAFARERYAYESGDRHRGENQQQVITMLIEKISNPHYLVRYADILSAAEGSFETNLTYDEITSFARYQLAELKNWQVESISLDGTGAMLPTYSMGSRKLYVMLPDQNTIDNAKAKIAEYLAK